MQLVLDSLIVNYRFYDNSATDKYLLILPGWMCASSDWVAVAEVFSESYKVVVLDFPGFGLSSKPPSDYDIYDYVDFVLKFLGKLGIEKCVVLGHSFGGRVGTILAAKHSVVEKLILVDSAGIEQKNLSVRLKQKLYFLLEPGIRLLPKPIIFFLRSLFGSDDYKDADGMREVFVKIVNQDLLHLLPKIKTPTLVIWGDKDPQLDVAYTKIYKSRVKNSLVRIVWGAGHNPHLEKPERFVEVLKERLC